jgi:hypothetical protein
MASAKLAPWLTDLIGSVAQSTFSHTRAVLVMKGKSFPGSANPFTPSQKQLDMRTAFGTVAGHWKELSELQIQAWCDLAATLPAYNKFHESYYQAGFNLFCQVNHNMQLIGESTYDDANRDTSVIPLSSCSLIISMSSSLSAVLSFNHLTTDNNTRHLVYATPSLSVGRFYVSNQYRLVSVIREGITDSFDFSTDYSKVFPDPVIDEKVSIKLIPINLSSGFSGTPLIFSSLVTS